MANPRRVWRNCNCDITVRPVILAATRYTATARHWTADAKAQHEAMGFEAGWGASADQLVEVARQIAAERA